MSDHQERNTTPNTDDMSDFDIRVKELELKYQADDVKLTAFNKFAWGKDDVQRYLEVSSWDHYYGYMGEEKDNPVEFIRYRDGIKPELTVKMKTTDKNNNDRDEVDVPLDPDMNQEQRRYFVEEFCRKLRYEINFSLYKYCSIFFYQKVDVVYYITFNEEMREQGRFVEIEARKDFKFASKEEAWQTVIDMEKEMSVLGITPKNRMKRSQWELNRRT
jgi:hypothetical protein